MRIMDRSFFCCSAEELAKRLVGKIICHADGEGDNRFIIKVRITVTEAYLEDDISLDYNRSKETTSQAMEGGHLHYHYNTAPGRRRMDIVAGTTGKAESVLIAETDMYDGPQKTLWALGIDDKKYDGMDLLSKDSSVWLEDDGTTVISINSSQRKNIEDNRPLRFAAEGFLFNKQKKITISKRLFIINSKPNSFGRIQRVGLF